jgi:hypothetical protein
MANLQSLAFEKNRTVMVRWFIGTRSTNVCIFWVEELLFAQPPCNAIPTCTSLLLDPHLLMSYILYLILVMGHFVRFELDSFLVKNNPRFGTPMTKYPQLTVSTAEA